MSKPQWEPCLERKDGTNVSRFMKFVNQRHGWSIDSYDALHD